MDAIRRALDLVSELPPENLQSRRPQAVSREGEGARAGFKGIPVWDKEFGSTSLSRLRSQVLGPGVPRRWNLLVGVAMQSS